MNSLLGGWSIVFGSGSWLETHLEARLSPWLGRVQAGEVVEVSSHRKAIARITGVKTQEQASTSPLQEALTAGLISWSGQKPTLPPPVRLRGKGNA